jgi:hypothetical protein
MKIEDMCYNGVPYVEIQDLLLKVLNESKLSTNEKVVLITIKHLIDGVFNDELLKATKASK